MYFTHQTLHINTLLHVDINLKFLSSAPVFVSRSRSVTPTMPEENENKEEEPDSTSGQSNFFFGGGVDVFHLS